MNTWRKLQQPTRHNMCYRDPPRSATQNLARISKSQVTCFILCYAVEGLQPWAKEVYNTAPGVKNFPLHFPIRWNISSPGHVRVQASILCHPAAWQSPIFTDCRSLSLSKRAKMVRVCHHVETEYRASLRHWSRSTILNS